MDDALSTLEQALVAEFQTQVRDSLLRQVAPPGAAHAFVPAEVVFSLDLSFNASVGLGQGLIPIYTFSLGACLSLIDACTEVCCHPDVMPHVVFAPDEVIRPERTPHPDRYLSYEHLFGDGRNGHLPLPALRNPMSERACLGNHLFEMVVKLISLHEQAHVLTGHLLFLNRGGRNGRLAEAPTGKSGGLPSQIARAMELQADRTAISLLLSPVLQGEIYTHPRGLWFKEAESVLGFAHTALIATAILVGILDRLDQRMTTPVSERSHPTAAARLLNSIEILVSMIRPEFERPEDGDVWIVKPLNDCLRVFDVLGCDALDELALNEYFNVDRNRMTNHTAVELHDLNEVSSDLVRELEPFKKTTLRLLLGVSDFTSDWQ